MLHDIPTYLPVYRRANVTMVRGEGAYLFDDCGNRYLDYASGIAVNALGHGHPHVVAALKAQADLLWHCSNNYLNDQLVRFADRLVGESVLDSVFFCSTGTEAVEAGIKFMRRFHTMNGQPQRQRIVTFEGGFHGRSITCISAGGNEVARKGYAPLLEGFDRVAFNDLAAVKAAISDETAGVLIEPVQGEGGVHIADRAYLQQLAALCRESGVLLMLDEVQCGYGRCGSLFTYDVYDVRPDVVACAKGIGNGFPLGACLVSAAVANTLEPGCHGSTYGSNPLAMAVGNAVLDIMQSHGFFTHIHEVSAQLMRGLQQLMAQYPDQIEAVRGLGLLIGVKTRGNARALADQLRVKGLLVAPAYGDVLRFVPPLIIASAQVDEALSITEQTLKG